MADATAVPAVVAMADATAYVHTDTTGGVPFSRVIIQNRPSHIGKEEELAMLRDAFEKTKAGKMLVELDSPLSLAPACLADILYFFKIRDLWQACDAPAVTFIAPPPILKAILITLELDFTMY